MISIDTKDSINLKFCCIDLHPSFKKDIGEKGFTFPTPNCCTKKT